MAAAVRYGGPEQSLLRRPGRLARDFTYLVLVPLALLGLVVARPRPAVSAAIVALGAGFVILSSEPNARYLYAAIPLVLVPVASLMAWLGANHRWLYRSVVVFLVVTRGSMRTSCRRRVITTRISTSGCRSRAASTSATWARWRRSGR